ncbi:hypothetical protein WN944_027197 [Citrus x changshan-huyou]|uniref:Uncharacterized protein n=1 Tax=Citrus x changshan-huyou TaxID=2935761 RepID=A0AAP0QCS1_9ROSI
MPVLFADNMDVFRMLVMCLIGFAYSICIKYMFRLTFAGGMQVGACDPECLSLVSLINDVLEEVYERHKYDNENFQLIVIIPWSNEMKHLKKDLEYINLVSLVLNKGVDFLKLDMDVVAMDTLSPVKRGILKAYGYESGYKNTEVQSQQIEQVYSDCESNEEDNAFNSENDQENSVTRTEKDLRERIFQMPTDDKIKLQFGQVFDCMTSFKIAERLCDSKLMCIG